MKRIDANKAVSVLLCPIWIPLQAVAFVLGVIAVRVYAGWWKGWYE